MLLGTHSRKAPGLTGAQHCMSGSSHGTNLVHRGAQTRLIGTKPDKSTIASKINDL